MKSKRNDELVVARDGAKMREPARTLTSKPNSCFEQLLVWVIIKVRPAVHRLSPRSRSPLARRGLSLLPYVGARRLVGLVPYVY